MDDLFGSIESASAGLSGGAENAAFLSLATAILPFYLGSILSGATF